MEVSLGKIVPVSRFLAAFALSAAVAINAPASAETRESYLERLSDICAVECMQPRQLLRAARKRGRGDKNDVAVIIDIAEVTLWNGKYLLHSELPASTLNIGLNNAIGRELGNHLGNRTPRASRPETGANTIVIEMDEATFFDLLNVPTPQEQAAQAKNTTASAGEDGEIIVERDRRRMFTRPTLNKLRSTFRNRRIVVRGTPRLDIVFTGARRDFRRKKLFIELDNADDLAVLPRYDDDGEPILDGPLEGLRAAYTAPTE
ncbi:MAG: hypothetical protein WBA51_16495 [Erythrobacter sp.]